jgi:acetyltransferase-like isoleucine patch superfamily enzyme
MMRRARLHFLDYAGIRLGEGVMVGPKVTFITVGHPVDPGDRLVEVRPKP